MRISLLPTSTDLQHALQDKAARVGVSGSFAFALVSLATSFVAPFMVQSVSTHAVELKRLHPKTLFGRMSLQRMWKLSHIFFSVCMFFTVFVGSDIYGKFLVGMAGMSWAVTTWAPFALISSEISRIQSHGRHMDVEGLQAPQDIHAGVIIGLHNVAVASPQILSALVCSIVLKILQAMSIEDSYGWLLRLAAIPALIAAYLVSDQVD